MGHRKDLNRSWNGRLREVKQLFQSHIASKMTTVYERRSAPDSSLTQDSWDSEWVLVSALAWEPMATTLDKPTTRGPG